MLIKYHLKEALYNKVVVLGDEVAPANTNKKNPKLNSTIGRDFIKTTNWKILNSDEGAVDEP